MSKLKATSGPYTVVHHSWEESSVYDANGDPICLVQIDGDVTEETQDHFEALKDHNAYLLAAAPEMYEALSEAIESLKFIVSEVLESGAVHEELLEDIRNGEAALSSARGEKS